MPAFRYNHGDRPLEGYTIQRGIGRGGFGEVYYALSDAGREVALKVIQGYEQIELRGVGHCMNLKSPHLVTVFDVRHNADGVPFVIMEYVAGPSLRDLLNDAPAGLGPQKAAFFLREIAKGLTYLHDRGIVHRDLKPGNIFYEDGYVKIGDYGLSKAMSASQHSGQTITVGTVHYMAPEIGQGRYDRGIDIYALGCVLYEMLTGTTPFLGASPAEVLMKHVAGQADLGSIDEPFATVLRKALAKNPAERYTSAQEMVEAVFGAEHIQQSVSCFSPESLSMVAERVARQVTVGGPGSSADHTRTLHAPSPTTPAGFRDAPPDEGGSIAYYLGRAVGHVQRQTDRWTHGDRREPPTPADAPSAPALVDPTRDPLDWNSRRVIGVAAAAAAAAGVAMFAAPTQMNTLWVGMLAFTVIGGAAGGLTAVRFKHLEKLRHEGPVIQRLAFTGMAGLMALAFIWPFMTVSFTGHYPGTHLRLSALLGLLLAGLVGVFIVQARAQQAGKQASQAGRLIYILPLVAVMWAALLGILPPAALPGWGGNAGWLQNQIGSTLLIGLLAILLRNWRKLTSPRREERISLWSAIFSGALGFAAASMIQSFPLLTAGLLAGITLTTQVLCPWDPAAVRGRHPRHAPAHRRPGPALERTADASGPLSLEPAGNEPRPSARAERGTPATHPLHDETRSAWDSMPARGSSGRPPAGYAPVPLLLMPLWAKAAALVGFVLCLGTGLLLIATATIAVLPPGDAALMVAVGIGAGLLALFCLSIAVRHTFRGWWASLIKPGIMLLCLQSIIASAAYMGGATRMREEETIFCLFLIIFPGLALLTLLFLPNRTVYTLSDSVRQSVVVADPARVPASQRLRGVAMLLAGIGLIPFCPIAGIHRFYAGKIGTGILWLLTAGLVGFGTVVDLIMLALGQFRDADGNHLLAWFNLRELKGKTAPIPPTPTGTSASTTEDPAETVPATAAKAAYDPRALLGVAPAIAISQMQADANKAEPPRQKGDVMGTAYLVLGGILLIVGTLIGLTAAVGLPQLIATGWPDPQLAEELRRSFGFDGWPILLQRIGAATTLGLYVLGIPFMMIGRRNRGTAHVIRGLLAMLVMLAALMVTAKAFAGVNWTAFARMIEHDDAGLAFQMLVESVLGPQRGLWTLLLLMPLHILLLEWPGRKKEPTAND